LQRERHFKNEFCLTRRVGGCAIERAL